MAVAGTIHDFAVIGAGIAGASVAAELAPHSSVLLLEMETQPGYHTTGRSAAVFSPAYGPPPIRALTRASADFFLNPPEGFCQAPLFEPLDVVMLAREDQDAQLTAFIEEVGKEGGVTRLEQHEVCEKHPLIRKDYAFAGALDRSGSSIDVHGLHSGYLNALRKAGGKLETNAGVEALQRSEGSWSIVTRSQTFRAATVINAAGAWADVVGRMAGAQTIGLVPKRRTALIVDAPDGLKVETLPLVVDIEEEFYMKPDAGRLLLSPANEDPMEPCDAQPDEMDVAICIDRIERAFDIKVHRIANKWAGLRNFVADKSPVVGFSSVAESFLWLAGQGGYGVQSAPALSKYAAAMALGHDIPADILASGLLPASLAPERLRLAA